MNPQLNPQSPKHLRQHPMVQTWIAEWQKQPYQRETDCRTCGWPHNSSVSCGYGTTFGQVRLGGQWVYVHPGNVKWLVEFVENLGPGFHWRDQVYIRREGGNVIVSRVDNFNGCPNIHLWTIPVREFASIVCAGSVAGETPERYAAVLEFLGVTPERGTP